MRVTEKQIKWLIHQSNRIEGYDDKEMDGQGFLAWRHILPLQLRDLHEYDILKMQKIITLTQTDLQPNWRGYFRNMSGQEVMIGGRHGMAASKVPTAMKNLLSTIEIAEPQTWHVEYEKIHPFVDGNGRSGRLILWWMQMRKDLPLSRITYNERDKYYGWFR